MFERLNESFKVLAPPPKFTVSQWADAERRLSAESSAEPGRWSTDRAPYQRGILDAVNEEGLDKIAVMAGAQVGKTELILNLIGYHVAYDPCPILVLQPTLEMAEAFSKDRIAPMVRDTPALNGKIKDPRARDSGNTLLHKSFPGGHLTLAGANSPSSLASRPVRLVLCDEVDRFPASAGSEGDPVKLAQKRAATFYNRLFIEVSTPTIAGSSKIEKSYEESDRRRYHVPCPLCGHFQVLTWQGIKYEKTDSGAPLNVRYECSECKGTFDDSHKFTMLAQGKWIAEAPFNGIAGFHINELYSPWRRWAQTVDDFIKTDGIPERIKVWVNTSLGETYEERGEAPEWERLYHQRETYKIGTVPSSQIEMLTAGCDVQKGRVEVEVVGWARDKQSWSIEHRVIHGDTSSESSEVWNKLDALLGEIFMSEDGTELPISGFGIDTGYETQTVYAWVRRHLGSRVYALKGQDSLNLPFAQPKAIEITHRGRRIKRGIQLWSIGSSHLKSNIYSLLRLPKPTNEEDEYPAGYCHFPQYPEEHFQQLTAEQLVMRKNAAGYMKPYWKKTRDRNEALDCRVMARAVASILGLDSMTDAQWERRLPKLRKGTMKPSEKTRAAPKGRERVKTDWL